MSLQIWLPFNNSLENIGITNIVTPSLPSAVSFVDGKIGKCIKATSNTNITYTFSDLPNMFANGKSYSLCCWVKILGNAGIWAVKIGSNSCGLWWSNNNSRPRWVWNENDNGKVCADSTTSNDTTNWHHLVIVVDKTVTNKITTRQYVDGVLCSDYPGSTWDNSSQAQPTGTTITVNSYVAMLNDLRIYDHCLTEKEIKEISKGLVVHYPLSQYGVANYFRNSNFYTETVSYWGGVNSSSVSYAEKDGYKCLTGTKGTSNNICCQIIEASSYSYVANTNVTFTISADIYVETTGTISIGNWISTTEASGWQGMSFTEVWNTSNTLKIGWNHVSVTHVNAHKQYNGSIITAFAYTGTTFWLTNAKFEFSDKESKWIPNVNDTIYTTLGFNSTTEYDTSGYKYNGTRNGTLTSTSDTPRYSISTNFIGNASTYIQVPQLALDLTIVTVSAWFKYTTMNNWMRIFDFQEKAQGTGYGFLMAINNSNLVTNTRKANGAEALSVTIQGVSINTWYHAVFVINGTTVKVYVNGALIKTYSITSAIGYASLLLNYLGKSNWSSDVVYAGNISDFRIYATALSDADILELYNKPITINKHSMITQGEYIEQ